MAEVAGKTNQVWWLAGASAIEAATGAKVAGVDNSSYQMLCDLLEITEFGDDYKNRLAGLLDTSMTISGNYYPGDTNGQDSLIVPGTTGFLGIYPSGTGSNGKQFQCIVESAEIGAEVNGKQTFSCTVQGIALPVVLPSR